MDATSTLLSHSRIISVGFHLNGTNSIEKESYVSVESYDLFRNNLPYAGGVCDAHMGTTDYSYKCLTCHNSKRNCFGHPGHIKLRYPVLSPMAIVYIRKWIKLICFKCGKPIIAESQYKNFSKKKRLDEASKLARTTGKKCVHCGESHPVIKKNTSEPLALIAENYEDKRQINKWTLLPHRIGEIFDKISDATVIELGKDPRSHPRNAVLHSIQAPSVTIRPDVKKIGGGRSTNDDLTTMLQVISKKNEMLPPTLPAVIDPKLEKAIFEINNAYYDFIKAGGDNDMDSISSRLKGKGGRFRKTQLGKRSKIMCRSTIAGNPRLRIDEVGIPLSFAKTIQMSEVVQEYNKKKLLEYVQNGRNKYPGATKVIKKSTGAEYDTDSSRDIELEPGDKVLRNMVDGDPVNFNRQPSLMVSNISTHKSVVNTDPKIKIISMNVLACALYNADFDGDQMNLIVMSNRTQQNEISELSSVSNWMISHTTSSPPLGQVDDSIIGLFEVTRNNVMLDKYHAMLLFQNTTILPDFTDVKLISGRDCVSMLLADTPINFTRVPEWYKENMSAYIKYDPSEIKLKIDRGRIVSGVLDKKSIGKNANGGIYHIIANEYGADKSLEVMYNMQQLAINYIYQRGYTIGIMDLMISEEAKKKIDEIAADIINKSRLITEELIAGEIIPSIGKTVEEFSEERLINTLSIFDDFTEPIIEAINPDTNNLFKLIACGSKGKIDNMFNMVSAIGQKLINGERIRQKFGFKRTLAYYPRFDMSPEARGYITNSYLTGMTSSEYVFNAMAARFDLISKALSTSITGEQNRKSVKNLESTLVNNYRWAVKNYNIINLAYGEDFLDPRKVERVKFPTVMISDSSFHDKYYNKDHSDFFDEMKADREKYREIFYMVEHMNVKETISDERRMPVEVERTVIDIIRDNQDILVSKPDAKQLSKMVNRVKEFCELLPYILINNIQEKLRTEIPEHISSASWLLKMLTRSHLHPNALINMNMTIEVLELILQKIRLRYSQALVDPGTAVGIIAAQSFSEPLTQYMLDAHHRSASGGTSKSGMTKAKEVLGAKSVAKLESPSMLLPVLPEYQSNKAKVQEIANNIEMMKFEQFIVLWQIFFEKYGEPVHTKYAHEKKMIEEFSRNNPILSVPNDLVKWCIRIVLDKTTLILKNMSLELIISRLRDMFSNCFIVYTPENSAEIIIRIYMRARMFNGLVTLKDVKRTKDEMLKTNIRGVEGIYSTSVEKMIRTKINEDGSISRNSDIWGIFTTGTNLSGIFANKFIDHFKVQTDAIQEVYKMLGIEAARQKIISEMRNLVDSCNHRHYISYADEMTYNGMVTSIESSGLKAREKSVLLQIGYSSPILAMEEAAINCSKDKITGVTAPLLLGSVPRIGTLYNRLSVDTEFIRKNVKKPDDVIDELFA